MTSIQRFRMNTPKVVHENFDDNEVVLINLDSGSYYSLDKVGADILSFIERGVTVSEIVAGLARLYESNAANIKNAIDEFLEQLRQEDLIVPYTADEAQSIGTSEVRIPPAPQQRLDFQSPVLHKYTDMKDLLLLDPIHEVDETGWPKSKVELSRDDEHH